MCEFAPKPSANKPQTATEFNSSQRISGNESGKIVPSVQHPTSISVINAGCNLA